MDYKERILKTLKDFGRLPTSRIAAIIGIHPDKAKVLLEELYNSKKIKKFEETVAVYWELIK